MVDPTNQLGEKTMPTQKAVKPGAVAVAAEEAARLDRRIASKRRGDVKDAEEASAFPKEQARNDNALPGVFAGNAAMDNLVAKVHRSSTTEPAPALSSLEAAVAQKMSAAGHHKSAPGSSMVEDSGMSKKVSVEVVTNITEEEKLEKMQAEDMVFMGEEERLVGRLMGKTTESTKDGFLMEQALETGGAPITTMDQGIVQEPDVEYGVYEPNEDGLAVAVAVQEEEEDVFIPSAVEYDPDAKPPLHRNRRFRLYGFLAFFALMVCAVGATVGIVLSKEDEVAAPVLDVEPRERFGIRGLIERLVGQEKLSDSDSAYSKALEWMIYEDPLQLTPENENFVQRYVLVYFYLSTSVEKPWKSCNPPVGEEPDSCQYEKLVNDELYRTEPRIRWMTSTHECEWAAISCDSNMQVRSVETAGQELSGTFPEGLVHLPFLQSITLPIGTMKGSIPTEIASMKHLVNLELHENQFSGEIPEELWDSQNLVRLNLGNNRFNGTIPESIQKLGDIKGLYLQSNDFSGEIPTVIGTMQSMTYLRLSRNRLKGTIPTELFKLAALQELWIFENELTGGIPTEIGALTKLNELRMRRNRNLGGQIPESFWNMTRMWYADVRECNLSGQISPKIGEWESLTSFRASRNPITGQIPTELALLKILNQFWIEGTDMVGQMPDEVCEVQSSVRFSSLNADCRGGFPESTDGPEFECACCRGCCYPDGSNCEAASSVQN